jgi:hypothetical protein
MEFDELYNRQNSNTEAPPKKVFFGKIKANLFWEFKVTVEKYKFRQGIIFQLQYNNYAF